MIELGIDDVGRGTLSFGSDGGDADPDELAASARTLLRQAFDSGGLRQVTWRAPVGDAFARRTAWLLGMTFEDTNRLGWSSSGTLQDAWVGSLLPGDDLSPTSTWREPIRLEGDRVVLRPVLEIDEQRYLETINDPESQRWLGTILTTRDSEAFRSRLQGMVAWPSLGDGIEWTAADRATDRLAATVTLFGLGGLDYQSAEVGYRTHPDARGRGVMTEALRLAITHAFAAEDAGGLGLGRIHLGAADGNQPSQRVARTLGFTQTGRDRRCYDLDDGSVVDLIRFDLLRSEWGT